MPAYVVLHTLLPTIERVRSHLLHIPAILLHKSPISFILLLFSFNLIHFSNLCNFRSARAFNFIVFEILIFETLADPNGVLTAFRSTLFRLFGARYCDLCCLDLLDDSPIQMSGKSGKPGTPFDVLVFRLHFLTSIAMSFIELLYRLGCSLCCGGMMKDVSSLVMGVVPTVKFDVASANSSSSDII
jgi:hypothetical protein